MDKSAMDNSRDCSSEGNAEATARCFEGDSAPRIRSDGSILNCLSRSKIFVKNLLVRCIVGINPEEREKKQDVVINLTLHADLSAVRASDNIDDSVDYKTVTKNVIALVEASEFFTVETLADRIADVCLENSRVELAEVTVEKPGALRFAESVGVVVTKRQGE